MIGLAELKVVPLEKVRIPDVRVSSVLDPEQRALLASTIREIGVVQDIVVRMIGPEEYELVAGNGPRMPFPLPDREAGITSTD